MNRVLRLISALTLAFAFITAPGLGAAEPGRFNQLGRGASEGGTAISPDGKMTAKVMQSGVNEGTIVRLDGPLGRGRFKLNGGEGVEFLWSPNSHALAITGVASWEAGPYWADVLVYRDGKFVRHYLGDLAGFAGAKVCRKVGPDIRVRYSTAAVAWVGKTNHLLVAAMLPVEGCPGAQPVFLEVDPSVGRVTKRYTARQAETAFGAPVTRLIQNMPPVRDGGGDY